MVGGELGQLRRIASFFQICATENKAFIEWQLELASSCEFIGRVVSSHVGHKLLLEHSGLNRQQNVQLHWKQDILSIFERNIFRHACTRPFAVPLAPHTSCATFEHSTLCNFGHLRFLVFLGLFCTFCSRFLTHCVNWLEEKRGPLLLLLRIQNSLFSLQASSSWLILS